MEKTLGQIAYEAVVGQVSWAAFPWARINNDQKQEWESISAAVAAAVKEEDARICEGVADRALKQQAGDHNDLSNVMLRHHAVSAGHCCDLIRASIKEGK